MTQLGITYYNHQNIVKYYHNDEIMTDFNTGKRN